MSAQISAKCGKLKKSKLEKICELETDLKVCQEENTLLRKQVVALQNDEAAFPSKSHFPGTIDNFEFQKMQDAFQAIKKVAITQEQNLNSLRIEVLQSRKKGKEQDSLIESLKSHIANLENNQKVLAESKSADQALGNQVENLQHLFFHEQGQNAKLRHELEEKNKAIASLQTRIRKTVHRRDSERGMLSRRESEKSIMSGKTSERSITGRNRTMSRRSSERSMMDASFSSSKKSLQTGDASIRSRRSTSERSLDIVSLESFTSPGRMCIDKNVSWSETTGNCVLDTRYVQHLEHELGTKTHEISELASQIETMNNEINNLKRQKQSQGLQAGESHGGNFYEDAESSDSTFW